MKGINSSECDVAIVGAGLSGLYAARRLVAAGLEVLVLEARERVGGRTLTSHFSDGTFVDDGGQWVSPGQDHIVTLAEELGVRLFPSWGDGDIVHWRDGVRAVASGPFMPGEENVAAAVQQAAETLDAMSKQVPLEAPWTAPRAAEWDGLALHDWLSANVEPIEGRRALANAFEGVFASNTTRTSLLAALFWAHSGDPLTPFVASEDPGPERRFDGGAQQLSERMAEQLGERVVLGAAVERIDHDRRGVRVHGSDGCVTARRAIVTLPPALCRSIRYNPALPAPREHLCERVPMRWVIKVHCLYPTRFWAEAGLSGAVISDDGAVRVCADNSPPSGSPGVLVGFIEEKAAVRLVDMPPAARRGEVLADLARYFGETALHPLEYRELNWGNEEYSRGADGGYWQQGVWTVYGAALRQPIGPLHWAGTETSAVWNGKMEGALLSARRAADEALASRYPES